jgi:hypothetical protein
MRGTKTRTVPLKIECTVCEATAVGSHGHIGRRHRTKCGGVWVNPENT